MQPRIVVVLHRDRSCPGRIGEGLRARGYALDICHPAAGEPLPLDLSVYAGAIVFGGPMSANDDLPFLRRETDWIGRVLATGTPYLGICLGAQLLARHLGARVSRHATGQVEIGFHPLAPTLEGRPLFPGPLHVYQWHSEGFDLPRGATLLARGRLFENQFFRYGAAAYGVQFHPEVTPAIMGRWLSEARGDYGRAGTQGPLRQHLGRLLHGPALARWLDGFLDQWLLSGPIEKNAARAVSRVAAPRPA